MRKFLTVLKFELMNYFQSKGYMMGTLVFAIILIIGLCIPSFIKLNQFDVGGKTKISTYGIVDTQQLIKDTQWLSEYVSNSEWKMIESRDALEEGIQEEVYKAGFIVNSSTNFEYLVNNSSFNDEVQEGFRKAMSTLNRKIVLEEKGIDYDEVENIYNIPILSKQVILGKDSVGNYLYTYILVFVLYMMIMMYGQMIAVSVTTEKSNRAMEILVTSTSTNSLIFGKVIAGTIASVLQVGVILVSGMMSYQINVASWGHRLDFLFNIPSHVLLTFATFGTVGYIFYAFIYGALGALVSKAEDVSKSVSSITLIFVAVFFVAILGMTNSGSMLMKVASYIPFSSCMVMFIRVAMGSVTSLEIGISLVILVVSTVIVGLIGSKIYRMGTLRYGNRITLSSAFKHIKKQRA